MLCVKEKSDEYGGLNVRGRNYNANNSVCQDNVNKSLQSFYSGSNKVKLIMWFFNIIDGLDADRAIVEVASSYLSRFLNQSGTTKVRETKACARVLRLAALTACYLALKVYGLSSIKISLDSLCSVSRNEFKKKEICEMEMLLLSNLQFNLHPPTRRDFVNVIISCHKHFNQVIDTKKYNEILDLAGYIADLSLLRDFSHYPSVIALASIQISFNRILTTAEASNALLELERLVMFSTDLQTKPNKFYTNLEDVRSDLILMLEEQQEFK